VARVQTRSVFYIHGCLYRRYALEWNVDFLKNDCVFGAQFVLDEVTAQSRILESLATTHGVDLVYSLSPGGHDTVSEIVAKGRQVSSLVSMYRVNNDDWDNWPALAGHFDVAAAFAKARLAGHSGLNGRLSFPDFDMLPLGYITCPGCNQSHYPYVDYTPLSLPRRSAHLRCCWMGRYHMTNLTRGEQRMQMALWGIAPSPLFFGGDLTRMDAFTYSLLTNSDLLWLNNAATKSEQIRQNNSSGVRIWRAQRQGMATIALPHQHNVTKYVGVFNTGSAPANEPLSAKDFGAQLDPDTNCGVVDVWTGMHIGSLQGNGLLKVKVASHDVKLLRLG
jgi:hypothetical protein